MHYVCQVITPAGEIVDENLEAQSQEVATDQLAARGLQVVEVRIDWRRTLAGGFGGGGIKRRVLIDFFGHAKGLLELGLNVTSAVTTVKESLEDPVLKEKLQLVEDLVDKGYSLHEALEQTNAFPKLALVSIQAAERSNRLEQVFGELEEHYRNLDELATNAKKAATYPVIALVVLTGVLIMLLLVVVPQLKEILPKDVPLPTRILVFLSDTIAYTFWMPFGVPLGCWILYRRLSLEQRTKLWESFYNVPVVGKVALNLELSTTFMNLAMLNGGGIPLLETLQIAAASSGSALLRAKLTTCHELATHGGKLTEAFRDPIFPPVVLQAIGHGEATGRFDKQFSGIAKFLRQRTANQLQFLSTFIEPAIILLGGGMLMLMATAIFMPIYGQIGKMGR